MLVSALLTSVGINLGTCILFFTLYSILRKQPGNIYVYAPRLIAEGKSQLSDDFNLERLLPSAGWVQRAWQPSEEDLLSAAGLDGVVLMRIFIFSLRVFSFAVIVGIGILLPVNYLGNQLSIDFSDLPNKSLDIFSISNVDNGSKRLWIHFSAVYVFTGVVCYLLYYEYKHISSKRITYFYASKPQPHQFTLLVRGIPLSAGKSFNDSVESFFTEFHPSTYLSHIMVRQTNKLQNLIRDEQKLYKRLVNLKSKNPAQKKYTRDGFLGLFGRRVDIVDHHEKKLEDLQENVRREQLGVSLTGEVPAAFVSFKSRYGSAVALHIQQSTNPTEWITEQAPEPHDVYWPFFSASFIQRWVSKLVVFVACFILTVLFLIPVVFVQGLTNLKQLEAYLPFLTGILAITFVSEIITGYLPSLILQLFLTMVPPIMKMLSSIQGYTSNSGILRSACTKVLWFTIWNIFFANVLSGSAFSQFFSLVLEPKNIPAKLAAAVPAQASFFIAYVVTSGWSSVSSELFRMIPLICDFIRRHCSSSTYDEFEVPSIPYHSEIPKILFFGLLGITYFFLAPLILPFLLAYYCIGYIIFRNQLLNVYEPKFETGGKFWPIVHTSTIFSLILMHILAFGLFGLKKLPLASSLCIPLPIVTLLFNDYCQKRFLPIFADYPAECLIKKDREDQNDPAMTEFLENLVTAYGDPSMMLMQHSSNDDGYASPLLQSREV
ncbi:CSC1-like protein HYP1 isoform X2 [Telopea speciosissima]|uniref:CSC1-like protein HYP1 isoform X2 n=1 Tax=Telopea speciosissima TaxID=54955 RepID=UPI001CC72C06|nr:CSC1-like protein HYP1 isoform X2 [Telopea speciosissima]